MFYFFSQEGMYKYFLSQSLKVAPWPSWTLYYLLQVGTTTALEVLNVLLKLMHLLEEAAELFGKIRKKKYWHKNTTDKNCNWLKNSLKTFFPLFSTMFEQDLPITNMNVLHTITRYRVRTLTVHNIVLLLCNIREL